MPIGIHEQTVATTAPPPLRAGDRLTQAEFERRYAAMPPMTHAELIAGVVYMASPARHEPHGKPHLQVAGWVYTYCVATPGVDYSDNATVRLDRHANEVQPDVLLRLEPGAGGRSRVDADGYVSGPPELVIEVAASSADRDVGIKRTLYQQSGVQEYLVWRVEEERVDWWELADGAYRPLPPDDDGVVWSRVFPGLCLNVAALLAGDIAAVAATVQQHVGTPAHRAFVERLAQASAAAQER
jgi:Uma2 family endonuclease